MVHKLTQSRTETVQTALTKTIHCTEYHFAEWRYAKCHGSYRTEL